MTSQPLRVGIVGLQQGRSWAAKAHVPALRALSADFVIAGIANTTLASAVQAAAALDRGPRPFASVADLVYSPDIDVVSVTVRVPHHLDVVKTAITAGPDPAHAKFEAIFARYCSIGTALRSAIRSLPIRPTSVLNFWLPPVARA